MPTARWSTAATATREQRASPTTTAPSRPTRATPPAYVGRGNIYRQQGQLDLALADYNAAIQLDRTDAQAFHNRGLVYQAQGQHQTAIEDFTTAIGLSPHVGGAL